MGHVWLWLLSYKEGANLTERLWVCTGQAARCIWFGHKKTANSERGRFSGDIFDCGNLYQY